MKLLVPSRMQFCTSSLKIFVVLVPIFRMENNTIHEKVE